MSEYRPRPIDATPSSDGTSYAVLLADGTTRNVPAAIFEALFEPHTPATATPEPAPQPDVAVSGL